MTQAEFVSGVRMTVDNGDLYDVVAPDAAS